MTKNNGGITMDMISYQMGKNSAPQPSGSLSITENGTYDVTEKASAVVNVQGGQSGLPIEIASSCPSPFLLNQNNLTSNVKYIFPTTTASVVPTSGTTVNFIQNTGTQYIDTGFKPNQDTKITMSVYNTNTAAYYFGGWNRAYNDGAFAVCNDINAVYCGYNGQGGGVGSTPFSNTNHIIEMNKNNVYFDGVLFKNFNAATFSLNYNLYLFAQNRSGTACWSTESTLEQRVFSLVSCKIYDNDTLVRDFIPAKSNEVGHENEVCLYDNVTEAYFYNQGTGTFTWGEATTPVTEIDVGDEVEISLSHVNAYATFSYQWQKLQNDEYVNISSATSSTYTAQTGDNAIRCILTGTGNSEGTIISSSIEVQEVD